MKYTLNKTDYDKNKFYRSLVFTSIMFFLLIHSLTSQNNHHPHSSKIVPVEKIVKDCSFFSEDTLRGFDINASVKEALLTFKNVNELKRDLYVKEIEFIRKKYSAKNFLINLTNHPQNRINPNTVLTSACNNIDFENGNFGGWTGSIGYNLNSNAALNSTAAGINTLGLNSPEASCSYHTVVSTGADPYSGLSMVSPGGGNYSARLGGEDINEYDGTDASGTYACTSGGGNGITTAYSGGEVLQQSFSVTSSNALFSYSYAVILNDGGHSNGQQPYFRLEVLDNSGNPIPCLQYYQQVTSGVPPPGYAISPTTNWIDGTTVYYSPWTQNSLNLTAYIGQNITVRFTAAGCNGGAHFGYAYVDCSCGPVQLISPSGTPCAGTNSTLTAPPSVGGSYQWSGPGIVSGGTNQTVTINTSGTYSVTVTAASGCVYTIDTTITFIPNPTVTVNSGSACGGTGVVLNASGATTSYSWSPGTGLSSTSGATVTANPASTTVYTVTGMSGTCSSKATSTVTVNPSPNASATSGPQITCGTATTTVNGNSTTAGVTYSWSGPGIVSGANTATATVNSAGIYTLTVTSASGCTTTATATITSNGGVPNSSATSGPQLTCVTNTSSVNGSSTTAGVTFSWSGPGIISGANTATATVNAAGTYTLTVTNTASGCTSVTTANITSNVAVPNSSAVGGPQINCTTSSSTVNGNSTTTGVTYSWSGAGITSGANTATATVNAAGVYTVTVTDPANGCSSAATATVTSNGAVPTISTTAGPQITCLSNTTTVNASSTTAGVTYSWSGAGIVSGGNTAVATVNAAGTYTITITDPSNGCTNTSTAVITSNTTPPNASAIAGPQIGCATNTTTVNGNSTTAGVIYNWNGPGIVSGANAATATVNAAGVYTLTVADPSNGCTSTATATVTASGGVPNSSASAGPQINCINNTSTANGNSITAGVTYSWSGAGIVSGANTATATVNAAGVYTLTVTDPASGCSSMATTTITANTTQPNVSASAGPQITCATSATTVNGNSTTAGVLYNWTGPGILSGANSATATVNAAGAYTLTVADPSNGCTNTAVATITSSGAVPNAVATAGPQIDCINNASTINGSSATAGVNYSWTGTGITSGANTATATVNAAGVYTLTVTDPSNGCSSMTTTTVTSNTTPPSASAIAGPQITCATNTTTVNGSSTTNGVTFNWSGPGIVSSANASAATVNTAGTYTVIITDPSNGCTSTATAIVNSNTTPPNASATGNQITCTTNTATVNGNSTTAGVNYNWSGAGIISGANTSTATVNAAGNYTLTVTDPSNGCTNTATANVTSNTTPPNVSTANGSKINCGTNKATVNAASTTSGVTYSWTGAGIISGGNTAAAIVNVAGNYTVTVTDPSNGCTATSTENVIPSSNPTVAIAPLITSGCAPLCVNFTSTVSAGGTYSWNFSDGTNSTTAAPNHCFTAQGTHAIVLTFTDSSSCVNSATVSVVVYPVPHADFYDAPQPANILDPQINFIDATTNSNINAWHWNFGDNSSSSSQNPTHIFGDTGTYNVKLVVTSDFGCSDSVVKPITIEPDYMIYVPNAFTPNSDGENDSFMAKGDGIKDFKLYVFDRWGNVVFFSDDIMKGWDGRYLAKGSDIVQEDVYVWKIELKNYKNKPFNLAGQVSLLK